MNLTRGSSAPLARSSRTRQLDTNGLAARLDEASPSRGDGRAVLDACGWTDIEVPPYCRRTDAEREAVQVFEDEVIDRLDVLNAERAAEEARLGLCKDKKGKQVRKPAPMPAPATDASDPAPAAYPAKKSAKKATARSWADPVSPSDAPPPAKKTAKKATPKKTKQPDPAFMRAPTLGRRHRLTDDRVNVEGGARSFAHVRPARIFRRGLPSPKV